MAYRKRDDTRTTKAVCRLGLIVSWVIGMIAIISGVIALFFDTRDETALWFVLPSTMREIFPLLVNVFVTLLNESMGYIHTCSLRWSLQREGKLEFNSNLRLLTSARHSPANAWYSNTIYLAGIVLTYSSTSLIFLSLSRGLANLLASSSPDRATVAGGALNENEIHVNAFAVISLGVGLVMQASVTTWALVSTDIPCWSANPFEVVRECMSENEGHRVHHRIGRCMMGVHMAAEDRRNVQPQKRQRPMFTAHHTVRWVFYLLAALPIVGAGWGGVVYYMIVKGDKNGVLGESWSLLPNFGGTVSNATTGADGATAATACAARACTSGTSVLNIGWSARNDAGESVAAIFFIAAFQAVLTLSLHCAELLVNLSRDEAVYRKLTAPRGTNGHANSIIAAATSWQTLTLFFFKAAAHWLFGLAINMSYRVGINMYPPQIFYFSALALGVALFCAFLAFYRQPGYLPSAFGHIQTIADIIDEWADSGCMFWGHKADGETPNEPSYAGTSTAHSLRPPYPDRLYGGTPNLTRDELMYRLGYEQASSQLLRSGYSPDPDGFFDQPAQASRASRASINSANSGYSAYSAASKQSAVPLIYSRY